MSERSATRAGGSPLRIAAAGMAGLGGLATAGAAVAGLDALVKVRPPIPPPTATLVDWTPASAGQAASVTLAGPTAETPGFLGLLSGGGRLLVSPPTQVRDGWRRHAVVLPGAQAPLLEVGTRFVVTRDPWGGCSDPLSLGAATPTLPTPVGELRLTTVAPSGPSRRAVVYLHGRGGDRHTGWWLAPTVVEAGWHAVMPSYRNDPDTDCTTGRYLLGGEWVDLVAVLDHLAAAGIEEVVLAGWSMGGNIAASYLRQRGSDPARFSHHPRIAGLVLDAAALDWGAVLRHVARARRLPHQLVPVIMAYGQWVTRIDWRGLDHVRAPGHLSLPVLAMHGSADSVVPVEVTHALAAALPHVEVHTFEGAEHCGSVNLDPARYLGALEAFLARVCAADAA